MDIDFRKEMEIFLDEYGIKVFLIRNLKHTRCSCYDNTYKSGDSSCYLCGGSGLTSSIEIIDAIVQYADSNSFLKMSEIGLQVTNTFNVYMKFDLAINEGDKILFVGFDKSNLPVDIKTVCEIKSSKTVRGDSGRIEFIEALVKITAEDIIKEQKRFNRIDPKMKRMLMKGKRYKWFSRN